jgi:hypothetical protein
MMACFKMGTILAYVVFACAAVIMYGIVYATVWGND